MHDAYIGEGSENNIKCVVHDDLKQLHIIAGFLPRHWLYSDFLSFIVVELIRFFHGAIQLYMMWLTVCVVCLFQSSGKEL